MDVARGQSTPTSWSFQQVGVRLVLAASACAAGLEVADAAVEGVVSAHEARQAAAGWGLGEAEPGARQAVVVVLVDGLGARALSERRGHTPTLRRWAGAETSRTLATCMPSTTAAALTTLGTGALPGVTGMLGYCVRNPLRTPCGTVRESDNLNLITFAGMDADPASWQDVPTIFERLRDPHQQAGASTGRNGGEAGIPPLAVTIGPARFAGSGLTQAALRGARHVGVDVMEDRVSAAVRAVRAGTPLVYLYIGELDHAGHNHGWQSQQWLAQLERADATMAELQRRLPRGTRVVLTADHGMVDTDEDHQVVITEHSALMTHVEGVAGEPRMTHLYVSPGRSQEVAERYRQVLGERAAWVGTAQEATVLLGPLSARSRTVVGDVVVAMAGRWVLVDPRVHSQAAMAMPGVHGSLTQMETEVPLLITQV